MEHFRTAKIKHFFETENFPLFFFLKKLTNKFYHIDGKTLNQYY